MLKAAVFDLDNTLYDYDRCNQKSVQALERWSADILHIEGAGFYKIFDRARKEVKNRLGNVGASHNRMLYMQNFLEDVGVLPVKYALDMYEVYWGTMLETMRPYEYVIPLFEYLTENGVGIGILTDLTAHIQHRKLKRLGLENYVQVLVTSEEAGAEKPDSSMFRLMGEKLGLDRQEWIMIGDSREKDIKGAWNAGVEGILYRTDGGSGSDGGMTGQEIMGFIKGKVEECYGFKKN